MEKSGCRVKGNECSKTTLNVALVIPSAD